MSTDNADPVHAPPPSSRLPIVAAPRSWRNWRASLGGAHLLGITEHRLFSDAWFIADAPGYGPYSFVNPVARTTHGGGIYEWKPALILRVEQYLPHEIPDMSTTVADHYHGGWLEDEIAALVALILGARIVAGPIDRQFEPGGDPFGQPYAHAAGRLPIPPQTQEAPQIPWLLEQRDLREIDLLSSLPKLTEEAAAALVKSARSYQQALWMADAAPEIAWLMFVSALETAAGFWDTTECSPAERLERSHPRLVRMLRDKNQEGLVDAVAQELHKVTGATSKFIGFCKSFKPDPPAPRPQIGKFDFDEPNYRKAIEKIYAHRSKALHGGIPFPYPMCIPPRGYGGDGRMEEAPIGLAASSYNAIWVAEDLPMHLHLFAHITRGALLNWWRTLVTDLAI